MATPYDGDEAAAAAAASTAKLPARDGGDGACRWQSRMDALRCTVRPSDVLLLLTKLGWPWGGGLTDGFPDESVRCQVDGGVAPASGKGPLAGCQG